LNIYLCGMIGSGKTTLGKRIAVELGREFYDLDQEMDRNLGYSFHRLVQESGWLAFRELEYSLCKRFARLTEAVVALGGGTVRYEWNLDALRGTGLFILLHASLETLASRVRGADRPRVNPGTSLEEDLRRIWESSGERYLGCAQLVYLTDHKTQDEAVREIKKWVLDRLGS
jgi:shikimate kinase